MSHPALASAAWLPDFPLAASGSATDSFLSMGLRSFGEAAGHIHRLPYGRNSDRSDYLLVLGENQGTCSTKHALLARLAEEQGRKVSLTLGIYEMTGRNTPGVGHVLEAHGLPCVPEAHCYLTYRGQRVDLTHPASPPAEPVERFLHEETIEPDDIGDYKLGVHERFVRRWAASRAGGLDWHEVLAVRESCVVALATG